MVQSSFTAALIRAGLEGYAGLAASRLVTTSGAAHVLGGLEGWKSYERTLLSGLAAALDDGSPSGFAARSAWSRDAFAARGVPREVLVSALSTLREVLEETLPVDAWSPLPAYFDEASGELARPARETSSEVDPRSSTGRIASDYVVALLGGDERKAIALVLDEVSSGRMGPCEALEALLVPAQREIGRLWHRGEIDVAEEHFVTEVTRKTIERVLAIAPAAKPIGKTAVVAAVSGDAHDIGVRLVAARFETDGWRTIFLGKDMPCDDLVRMAARLDADVVVLGATLDTQREAVRVAIAALRAARPRQRVVVGGPAFSQNERAWVRTGADACASDPREAVARARALTADR